MAEKISVPVITIDGPSGSGKGTVSREIARQLGFHFLDSGALYRVLALAASRRGIALDNEAELAALSKELDVRFPAEGNEDVVLLDGEDVTAEIRTEAAGSGASRVAVRKCGVQITCSNLSRGLSSPGGSCSKTSMAAPATRPLSIASANADSSISPPVAQLMI